MGMEGRWIFLYRYVMILWTNVVFEAIIWNKIVITEYCQMFVFHAV